VAMSNLASRVLTAVVALPPLGALVLWDVRQAFGALVIVCAAVGLVEYTGMLLSSMSRPARALVVGIGTALATGLYLRPDLGLLLVLGGLLAGATLVLLQPGEIAGAAGRLGIVAFGLGYLGMLPPTLALMHRDLPDGPRWVFVVLLTTFASDTGAYFAGRALGRHKLYPAISPGKTVEGGIGGVVASLAAVFVARATFLPTLTVADVFCVAIPAAILGPIGDLVESMIKRSAGVKDSGRLFPGHGGILDRLDALLFVSAWVYAYAVYLRG
jgi:phosphatidate cytidylyltransferase